MKRQKTDIKNYLLREPTFLPKQSEDPPEDEEIRGDDCSTGDEPETVGSTDDDSIVCETRTGAEIGSVIDDCCSSDDCSAGAGDEHKEMNARAGPVTESETGDGLGMDCPQFR